MHTAVRTWCWGTGGSRVLVFIILETSLSPHFPSPSVTALTPTSCPRDQGDSCSCCRSQPEDSETLCWFPRLTFKSSQTCGLKQQQCSFSFSWRPEVCHLGVSRTGLPPEDPAPQMMMEPLTGLGDPIGVLPGPGCCSNN